MNKGTAVLAGEKRRKVWWMGRKWDTISRCL